MAILQPRPRSPSSPPLRGRCWCRAPILAAPVLLVAGLGAQVTHHDERGRQLVAADVEIRRLATGRRFLEGPVWLSSRGALLCSDIPAKEWLWWDPVEGCRTVGPSAGANGNAIDAEGRVISCQHEARNVVRWELDGTKTVLAAAYQGRKLNSPNDVAVHRDGSIWFTDPTYGLGQREREQDGNHVYRLDPASGGLRIVSRGFDQPNGLCFAPDHRRLYIADSGKPQRVGAFPVAGGGLGEALFWLDGGADGMRCDVDGNLWTAARDGVRVYAPDGTHLLTIALPEQPANCAFGGADGHTLFITARSSLYALAVRIAGAALPPQEPAPK